MPFYAVVLVRLAMQIVFFCVGTYLSYSVVQLRKVIGRVLQILSVVGIVLIFISVALRHFAPR